MAVTCHRAWIITCPNVLILLGQCRQFRLDRLLDDLTGVALDSLSRPPTSPLYGCFIDPVNLRVDGGFHLDGSDAETLVLLALRPLLSKRHASVHVCRSRPTLLEIVTWSGKSHESAAPIAGRLQWTTAEPAWSLLKRHVSVRSRTFNVSARLRGCGQGESLDDVGSVWSFALPVLRLRAVGAVRPLSDGRTVRLLDAAQR